MAPIGLELKRERELRGISLQEISDATKINLRYLRDLEEDRLDSLPGKFFTKGIIRSYANYIGLEEDAVLNSYYESEQLREQESEQEKEERKTQFVLPFKVKKILYSIALFLVLMAVLTVVYVLIYQKPQEQKVEEAPTTEALQKIEPIPPPEPEPVVEEKELTLDLSFHLKTWIQVYADGELVIEGLRQIGDEDQVKAKNELLIHTGNAGGMSFRLNNKKGKLLGAPGEVVRDIRITLDNMEDYIEEEVQRIILCL
ncbi:MAG: DUF4115 domain-containing protein [Candidatus Aminicenantes bacterium]|jgi:transcriptional regulator with XRE-family HTH domain